MAEETPYREMDTRGFGHSHSVHEKRLEATMTDIVTYCDVNTCEDCPRYGDDCDGDKRVEHTDYIRRADAVEAVKKIVPYVIDKDTGQWGILVNKANVITELSALPSAEAVQGDECDHCVYKWGMKGGDGK